MKKQKMENLVTTQSAIVNDFADDIVKKKQPKPWSSFTGIDYQMDFSFGEFKPGGFKMDDLRILVKGGTILKTQSDLPIIEKPIDLE